MTTPRVLTAVNPATLRRHPLPTLDESDDKDARGRVLVVAGAVELPGAALLAGVAALRAGAGKLQIATAEGVAVTVGVAVPEALVAGLPQGKQGGISSRAADRIVEMAAGVDAVLVGPGMMGPRAIGRLLDALVPALGDATLVLDAGCLPVLADRPQLLAARGGRVVLTPHTGEMAAMLGVEATRVREDPVGSARRAAATLGATVALKGAVTHVATPGGELFRYAEGKVGLATSGSGDTLAGVVAGLAARGAPALTAALWGVYLHGEAGNVLSARVGRVGFLARELLDEVPALLHRLTGTGDGA